LRIAAIQRLGTEVEAGMGEAECFAAVLQLKADGAFGKLLRAIAGKLIDIAGAGNAEAAARIYVIGGFGGFEACHEGHKRREQNDFEKSHDMNVCYSLYRQNINKARRKFNREMGKTGSGESPEVGNNPRALQVLFGSDISH